MDVKKWDDRDDLEQHKNIFDHGSPQIDEKTQVIGN